jgi:hypothetical protein
MFSTLGRGLNAAQVAAIRGGSVPALNRAIREGHYAPPDYHHGPYRIWTEETVQRERERAIREDAAKIAHRRAAQRDAAENARDARQRKRAERAAAEQSPDAVTMRGAKDHAAP